MTKNNAVTNKTQDFKLITQEKMMNLMKKEVFLHNAEDNKRIIVKGQDIKKNYLF
ncbi:hypothetical protein SAMN02745165_00359 [Malonomonas rubra DSM 5091]|uniref:Uncharacterized protein n=1 Tax=Malonomonas rubra DSM 5091 TaxID=1122189 RepID=A0A1M6C0V9_MALRU|nr:hypothetical protein SAMN02745165_00359 [Malonomonas rubra DSM 5091]